MPFSRAAAVAFALIAGAPALAPQYRGLVFGDLFKEHLPMVHERTRALAGGDVDGDGDLDVVLAGEEVLRLQRNDGRGRFTESSALPLVSGVKSAEDLGLADLDGDGRADLLVAAAPTRLFLGDGKGGFQESSTALPAAFRVLFLDLALGDVDGDGDTDILAVRHDQLIFLLLNDGKGTFADATLAHLPSLKVAATDLALGDVDGDRDLDLVVGIYRQQPRLLLNVGGGFFFDGTMGRMPGAAGSTQAVALGDVDGDGDLDLVVGNDAITGGTKDFLFLNDGKGYFSDATAGNMPLTNLYTVKLALGDVDGDGDLDLIEANGGYAAPTDSPLSTNDGQGRFTPAPGSGIPDWGYTPSLLLFDADGDGDPDLYLGRTDGGTKDGIRSRNALYLNDGRGGFRDGSARTLPCVNSPQSLAFAAGDVDGNGRLDVLAARRDRYALYLNDGGGGCQELSSGRIPATPSGHALETVALGDVDGDGDLDLIAGFGGSSGSYPNRLYRNDGKGFFADVTVPDMPAITDATTALAMGDVDGDGDLDLVTGNYGQLDRLYLNNGQGHFSDATSLLMPLRLEKTQALALGDVDGDGDLDLVVGVDQAPNRLYLNDGRGSFADATAAALPPDADRTGAVALGDVDGDGDRDLFVANIWTTHSQNRLLLNDGSGRFTDATQAKLPPGDSSAGGAAMGDMDLDGDLDLVLGDSGSIHRLLVNDGSGTFTNVGLPIHLAGSEGIALADLDGDGDLDLMACFKDRVDSGLTDQVWTNLTRQAFLPFYAGFGSTLHMEIFGPPNGFALVLLSDRGTRLALPPFGTLEVDLLTGFALPVLPLPPAGEGLLALPIPAVPGLGIRELYLQALLVPAGDLLRSRFTNLAFSPLL